MYVRACVCACVRDVVDRYKALRENDQREECVMLLEAWEGFEQSLKTSAPDGNRANISKARCGESTNMMHGLLACRVWCAVCCCWLSVSCLDWS